MFAIELDLSLHKTNQSGERNGRLVDLAHEEPLKYHRIESASGPPNKKTVELNNELEINIIRFGGSSFGLLTLTTGYQIDTLHKQIGEQSHGDIVEFSSQARYEQ